MSSFLLNYDLNPNLEGVNGFGRQPANYNGNAIGIYNTLVGSASDTTLLVPTSIGAGRLANNLPKILAIFSYASLTAIAPVAFVAVQTTTNGVTTAAPDASGTFTANPAILNPTALLLKGGDILHFYSVGATMYASVEFYSVT